MKKFSRLITSTKSLLSQSYIIKLICLSGSAALTIRYFLKDSSSISSKATADNERLVCVHLFSRHGARTPLHIISGIEEAEYSAELLEPFVKAPYVLRTLSNGHFEDIISYYDQKNFDFKLKGGAGRGQLTQVGEKQMFDLGRRIRQKYIEQMNYLSPNYDPNEFYTRSSHYKRTINSAKSFLAGVFNQTPNDADKTFIINVHNLNEDYLFPNALDCSYYAQLFTLKFFKTLDLLKNKDYMKHLNELKQVVLDENAQNENITFTRFRDDMVARKVHNMNIPKEMEEFYLKSDTYASMEMTAMAKHNLKISCGRLLNMIKNNLNQTVQDDSENKSFHKFRYYSAHDTTLNAIMNAFELIDHDNEKWPPFAANIAIELWKQEDKNSYFIKFFYCDQPFALIKNNNELKCSLEDFIQLLKKNEVDQLEYSHICSKKWIE